MTTNRFMEMGLRDRGDSLPQPDAIRGGPPEAVPTTTGSENPPDYSASALPTRHCTKWPITDTSCSIAQSHRLPCCSWSDDKSTCEVVIPPLVNQTATLVALIQEQLHLPPKPTVRVRGTHADWCYSWGNMKIDFDLTLDITPLLRNVNCSSSGFGGAETDSKSQRNVFSEIRHFCEESTSTTLRIERRVTNWNTKLLEREIRAMIFGAKYMGDLEISFPVACSKVIFLNGGSEPTHPSELQVKSSKTSRWLTRSKPAESVQDIDYATLQHGVSIDIDWQYATIPAERESSAMQRQYFVQSEQEWLQVWKEPIRNAVLKKRVGWISIEDWKDLAIGYDERQKDPDKTWGTSADEWSAWRKSMKWGDKEAAKEYMRQNGLTWPTTASRKVLPRVGIRLS